MKRSDCNYSVIWVPLTPPLMCDVCLWQQEGRKMTVEGGSKQKMWRKIPHVRTSPLFNLNFELDDVTITYAASFLSSFLFVDRRSHHDELPSLCL